MRNVFVVALKIVLFVVFCICALSCSKTVTVKSVDHFDCGVAGEIEMLSDNSAIFTYAGAHSLYVGKKIDDGRVLYNRSGGNSIIFSLKNADFAELDHNGIKSCRRIKQQ